tara:strand:- start:14972 stop:15304 length:333 start_codon:yes stop_codon:yes gene_type:complete
MKRQPLYRQGDVLCIPIDAIPTDKKLVPLDPKARVTLALGEATGHHHTLSEGSVEGWSNGIEALAEYFEVTSREAVLTHQEHDAITLPKGVYERVIQTEYTPEKIVRVAD